MSFFLDIFIIFSPFLLRIITKDEEIACKAAAATETTTDAEPAIDKIQAVRRSDISLTLEVQSTFLLFYFDSKS